jgi:uncharacterized protein (TIGR03663 family)
MSTDPPTGPAAISNDGNRAGTFALGSQWTRWVAFLLVALLGLVLRLPQLGARPMHTDEAVNAYIVGQLLAGGSFTYDPRDRHGPALAALALPLARMQGAKAFSDLTESELRLASVLAGTVTILLFGAAAEMFGFVPCLIAALLFAVAPLPVYYDRYFIHESLFAAATFGLILTGWRACKRQSTWQSALAGACAALMLACKETAVLHFFALAAAAVVFWLWNLRGRCPEGCGRLKALEAADRGRNPGQGHNKHPSVAEASVDSNVLLARLKSCPFKATGFSAACLAMVAAFLLVSVILYTWFGSNWKAPTTLLQAGSNFFARAGGEGHQKPVWYFVQLLTGGWSGGMICFLACIGFFQTVRKRDPSPFGLLAFYALFLAIIYSLIPYKTPWLALNFWLPIALFAGLAIQSLWRMPARHPALRIAAPAFCILVGVVSAALIAHDTRQRVFVHPADESNPYAYAHTSEDLLGLPVEIEELARQNAIATPRIAVIASDPWPLPWYLRHFSQVGFWQPGQQAGEADFYITSSEDSEDYGNQLQKFRPEFFGARPGVLIVLWSPEPK